MSYHHLTRNERGKIALMQNNRKTIREIAKELGRSPSTISRELRRNKLTVRYRADPAQTLAAARRRQCRRKPKYEQKDLSSYVQEKLLQCWSPEQISGRLPLDYPDDTTMRVSHSSIYRWLYEDLLTQAAALRLNLRHSGHRHGEKRGRFHGVRELKERSKLALKRKRLGDWEADTIVSSSPYDRHCLLTVCDRKSRYCGIVLLRRRSSAEVMRGFRFLFDELKLPLETVTADRGTEFACYSDVESEWNMPFYFARPSSPWQKPSIENTNGLIRQFFPKGTLFQEISEAEIIKIMTLLNNRPRKCLGFRSPAEVLHFT